MKKRERKTKKKKMQKRERMKDRERMQKRERMKKREIVKKRKNEKQRKNDKEVNILPLQQYCKKRTEQQLLLLNFYTQEDRWIKSCYLNQMAIK